MVKGNVSYFSSANTHLKCYMITCYDILIGNQVRKILFGHSEASYSGYTCYTGIADFVPADIESVG